jgi:hypothetical protein
MLRLQARVGIALISLCFNGTFSCFFKESSGILWNPALSLLILLVHVLLHTICQF